MVGGDHGRHGVDAVTPMDDEPARTAMRACAEFLASGEGDQNDRELVAWCALQWAQFLARQPTEGAT